MTTSMQGKQILLTGGTSGIGLEAAVALAGMGAHVTIVGRDPARTERALAEIRARSGAAVVESLPCDFAVQSSIRALAEAYGARHDRLDVLINNAGTVFATRTETPDGIESTFAVNHLGYFLLTNLLLPLLERSAPARVVNVSSRGHYRGAIDFDDLGYARGGYFVMSAYNRAKLANVLFTRELARRCAGRVTVNCLHPGVVATNIWAHAPWYARPLLALYKLGMITPAQGARTIIHLASSPAVASQTGKYFDADTTERKPSRLALDDALARRLWDESARLVGLAT